MTKRELGESYFTQGYNCAQAVALAFEKELNLDKDFIARTISGFGGGFGRMREVCGAISGMVFVLSNLKGSFDPTNNNSKMEIYKKVQTLMKEFKEKNGSIVCRELLGLSSPSNPTPEKRTDEYYKKRPCASLVGDAVEILEEYLNSINN